MKWVNEMIHYVIFISRNTMLFFIFNLAFMFCFNQEIFSQEDQYPVVSYKSDVFVSVDYTFLDEGLYKPWKIRLNPKTNEIVVLDFGNLCLYVFTLEGKFIRKIGREGQGPGDFYRLDDFDFDSNGNIYVLDSVNLRMSIFSQDGKFSNSFRIASRFNPMNTSLFINNNDEIVVNLSRTGYYFTVFNINGEILRSVGEIERFGKKRSNFDEMHGHGIPIIDSKGNYYIFLSNRFMVKIYDSNGELKKEMLLDSFIPKLKDFRKNAWTPPEKQDWALISYYFTHVKFVDNKFYIMIFNYPRKHPIKNMLIFVLNTDLNIIKECNLIFPYDDIYLGSDLADDPFNFEILSDGEKFIVPVFTYSEILLFSKEKK